MNDVNILLTDNENFKYVEVVFAPYTGTNTYHYKTMLDVDAEDFLVVETPGNKLQVVQVVSVIDPFEFVSDANISYKWIVSKVDFTHYKQVLELEKQLVQVVNRTRNRKAIEEAKETLKESLGSDVEVTKLVRL